MENNTEKKELILVLSSNLQILDFGVRIVRY